MKFKTETYGNQKGIVKFPDHYVNIPVTVSDAGVSASNGKKIVPAGTILGGGVFEDDTKLAVKATTAEDGPSNAEGVLFEDVDVTDGPAAGALLIHGFVDLDKIPSAPSAEEKAALNQITFLK